MFFYPYTVLPFFKVNWHCLLVHHELGASSTPGWAGLWQEGPVIPWYGSWGWVSTLFWTVDFPTNFFLGPSPQKTDWKMSLFSKNLSIKIQKIMILAWCLCSFWALEVDIGERPSSTWMVALFFLLDSDRLIFLALLGRCSVDIVPSLIDPCGILMHFAVKLQYQYMYINFPCLILRGRLKDSRHPLKISCFDVKHSRRMLLPRHAGDSTWDSSWPHQSCRWCGFFIQIYFEFVWCATLTVHFLEVTSCGQPEVNLQHQRLHHLLDGLTGLATSWQVTAKSCMYQLANVLSDHLKKHTKAREYPMVQCRNPWHRILSLDSRLLNSFLSTGQSGGLWNQSGRESRSFRKACNDFWVSWVCIWTRWSCCKWIVGAM